MILALPVESILAQLPSVRRGRRLKKRTHGTNYAELCRLLEPHDVTLSRQYRETPSENGTSVLRVKHEKGANWHWMLLHYGVVYDSVDASEMSLSEFLQSVGPRRVSYYSLIVKE